ncbi:MAG: hypothetical protein KatS3mg104_0107 [Phycisphaerae bacterium]|nr:MAG: hypothetical protein KatS3mg104_0107 [Phycisphaerae bacterium]
MRWMLEKDFVQSESVKRLNIKRGLYAHPSHCLARISS